MSEVSTYCAPEHWSWEFDMDVCRWFQVVVMRAGVFDADEQRGSRLDMMMVDEREKEWHWARTVYYDLSMDVLAGRGEAPTVPRA